MRDKAAAASIDTDVESPLAPFDNPWAEPTPDSLRDLESTTGFARPELSAQERAAQYTDWANRMREKRQRVREAITRDAAGAGAGGSAGGERVSYWTTDALFEDSKRAEDDDLANRPNPWRVRELYATLDLDDSATPREVGSAYKRLAKEHHPDRYVTADPETQEHHAEKMRDINHAYRSLKELELA
jgi:DnaJ-domain-containing protein 1